MNELWYDYVKPKYDEKLKLFYMVRNTLIGYIKIDAISKDIAENVETRFDTSNDGLDRVLPERKLENLIGLIKDELGGKIMIKLVGLRANTYSYLIDDYAGDKKDKGKKKWVIKR